MTEVMKKSVGQRVLAALIAILLIVAGVMFIRRPIASVGVAALVYVCFFTASGIMQIIQYLAGRKNGVSGWILFLGIVDTILGVYLLCHTYALVGFLPFLLAFWAVFTGIGRMIMSVQSRKINPIWGWTFAMGICLTIVGILMFFAPLASILSVSFLFALALFFMAAHYVVEIFSK